VTTKVSMPQLGESVVEGTVGKWLVSEGDAVAKDQPIVEILTDKADSEVPSPVAGVVRKIHAVADAVVSVGAVLCEIEAGATAGASPAASAPAAAPAPEKPAAAEAPSSPSVRKLAREAGVDLVSVKGSGPSGRITADDVRSQGKAPAPSAPPAPSPAPLAASPRAESPLAAATGLMGARPSAFKVPAYRPAPGDQVIPFSRRRRIIADHMVYSKQTSPEVVTFAECDLDATARLRDKFKDQYKKEGVSLTYLAFTLAATARALREFPELNARVLDDAYVKLRDVNLGIAVDTPDGLVVPVIRNADELTVRGLARAVTDIAVPRARRQAHARRPGGEDLLGHQPGAQGQPGGRRHHLPAQRGHPAPRHHQEARGGGGARRPGPDGHPPRHVHGAHVRPPHRGRRARQRFPVPYLRDPGARRLRALRAWPAGAEVRTDNVD
jgi:2-oxoglutarate dehydrogenase E2 component (dihydrolipoamide succinyltransferase)